MIKNWEIINLSIDLACGQPVEPYKSSHNRYSGVTNNEIYDEFEMPFSMIIEEKTYTKVVSVFG